MQNYLSIQSANRESLHRIRTVRLLQGLSMRTVARHLGTDQREAQRQEMETTDLRLSDLHAWQRALDVPLAELLVEPDGGLLPVVADRARLVRIMKTVVSLEEQVTQPRERRLVQMLGEQLRELMPELQDVTAWPSHGRQRSNNEFGRAYELRLSEQDVENEAPCSGAA